MHTLIAVAVFFVVYVFIATERFGRVATALTGAGLLLAAGVMHSEDAFFSEETGVDWNVILLLLGMMIIVGVIGRTGLFDYMGVKTVKVARAKPLRIMTLLVIITALASALLDNVTTVLLMAPITLTICRASASSPCLIYLQKCSLQISVVRQHLSATHRISSLPVVPGSRSMTSLCIWLRWQLSRPAILVLMLPRLFRGSFTGDESLTSGVLALNAHDEIRDVTLLRRSLVVLTLVLAGFLLHPIIHVEPAIVALIGAGVLILITKLTLEDCVEDVEWETLVFFMALFVMVGALVKVGVIADLAAMAADRAEGNIPIASLALLAISAVVSGIVDNIPYVAAMSPLVADVVRESSSEHGVGTLWWALALGADFGGNATAIGASANVVMLGIAMKAGHPITFWEFTRKGLIVTVVTIAACFPYVWLRYFVLA